MGNKRIISIDYGDSRVGVAITDALGITAQGLETIQSNGNDKIVLRRLDEIFSEYDVGTIVVGKPINSFLGFSWSSQQRHQSDNHSVAFSGMNEVDTVQ